VILCGLTTRYPNAGACFRRLKLEFDEPLSNVDFEFNLRRYNLDSAKDEEGACKRLAQAGASTRPLLGSTEPFFFT